MGISQEKTGASFTIAEKQQALVDSCQKALEALLNQLRIQYKIYKFDLIFPAPSQISKDGVNLGVVAIPDLTKNLVRFDLISGSEIKGMLDLLQSELSAIGTITRPSDSFASSDLVLIMKPNQNSSGGWLSVFSVK